MSYTNVSLYIFKNSICASERIKTLNKYSSSKPLINKLMGPASDDTSVYKLMAYLFNFLHYGLTIFPKCIWKHEKEHFKKINTITVCL